MIAAHKLKTVAKCCCHHSAKLSEEIKIIVCGQCVSSVSQWNLKLWSHDHKETDALRPVIETYPIIYHIQSQVSKKEGSSSDVAKHKHSSISIKIFLEEVALYGSLPPKQ